MKQHGNRPFGLRLRRALSGLLCALMLCSLLPDCLSLTGTARAAEARLDWDDADLETLNSLGIMRGNENGDMMPNKSVTRAEFAVLVNKALGYQEKAAKLPFRDVAAKDWFADDISISYNMGYMAGTSNNMVSPNGTLTREQALVILGRNLMLQPSVGESFSYADSRSFGSWSRSYIEPAIEAGIIEPDRSGSFNPQKQITRGELAGMLVRAIGTPIQRAGVTNLGTVDGNVTITASGVTLRNTTINGDLYLTGGVGLGNVLLDNVTVNGKIIDSGAGLSEKGEISVILNNVTADELVVDSMRNQTISLSAQGRTAIPKTSVRTSSYLDDSTSTGYGLTVIEIDGEEKTAVTVAGNVKEVHNKTPKSTLNMGEGVAEKVTVDEAAAGSTLTIGKDARIKALNLDAGIKVDGSGSIDKVSISANGATVAQLPDEIVIAPGITATVNKQKMDTAAAIEASSRPRLASGYPVLDNLTPTTADGLFMTNKPGTVYWAVTALSDGSPAEEDIIAPPTYSKTILKSGKVQTKESNKEYTVKISGLTSDASYYLSAIMVDDRGTRGTMKVTAFTTPDNTTPAFSKGYPAEHSITEQDAQFAVMTTKSCNLFYALLPKGSTAPRAIDFKTGAISGNLGQGTVKMEKNNPAYIFVNDITLEEQKEYVLYLWLSDFDGAKSSAVKAVNFKTQDKTNPIVSNMRQTNTLASSATLSYTLSEQGTLYWAVVATGNETFMSPSSTTVTGVPFLQTQEAKERIVSGVGALKKGTSSVTAAKAGADIGFTVSGLNTKTTGTSAYDLYYVARDKAGNWSDTVTKITIYTLDTTAPKAQLKFTSFNQNDSATTKEPLGDTDIKIVFTKAVCVVDKDSKGISHKYVFLDLYQQGKFTELADALRKHVLLYKGRINSKAELVKDELKDSANYVIDYSKARVYMEGTDMVLEFPYDSNSANSAHHLANGGEYYFELKGIQDTGTSPNLMGNTKLDFKVKQAQVNIESLAVPEGEIRIGTDRYPVDDAFKFDPVATSSTPDGICYDILLWSDVSMEYNLFRRVSGGNWTMVGDGSKTSGAFKFSVGNGQKTYNTIAYVGKTDRLTFHELNDPVNGLREDTVYEFAISFVKYKGSTEREKWGIDVNLDVTVAAGAAAELQNIARQNGTDTIWTQALSGRVDSIGSSVDYPRHLVRPSNSPPIPAANYPVFNMRDTSGTISMSMDRKGKIYWIVSKLNYIAGTAPSADTITGDNSYTIKFVEPNKTNNAIPWTETVTPWSGPADTTQGQVYLSSPTKDELLDLDPTNSKTGILYCDICEEADFTGNVATIRLEDLVANSWYAVYMVFDNFGGGAPSEQTVCYRFKTHEAYDPILALSTEGTAQAGMVTATVTESSAYVDAKLIPASSLANTPYNDTFNKYSNLFDSNTVPTELDGLTIWKAMMERNGNEERSLFDALAPSKLKNDVAGWITSGGTINGTGSVATKKITIRMGNSSDMSFPGLSENNEYVCVAVATNTSDSTKRGFRAVRPVEVVDTNPPVVSNAGGNLTITRVDDETNHVTKFTVSGTVTISYKGYLYIKDSNGTTCPFTQGGQQNNTEFDFREVNGRNWAGARSVYIDNIFQVKGMAGMTSPQMTQNLILTVENFDLGTLPYTETREPVLDKDGAQVLDKDGKPLYNISYKRPDYPIFSGTILFPTVFVNRNGSTPTNTGKITYANKAGQSNVTVTYSSK